MKRILSIVILNMAFLILLTKPAEAGNSSIFTISAWVKPEGSVANKAIVAKAEELRMFTNSSGYLGCQIKSSTWQAAAQATTNALSLNNWSFVACSYDKTNLKVFVNGIQVGSQSLTATIDDTANPLKYGVDDSSSTPYSAFQGTIDEMKFYNYARTQKQIIEDMNAGHPIGGSPVGSALLYLKLDEGHGTTAHDSGYNEDNGVLTDGPTWTNEGKFGKGLDLDGLNDRIQGFTSDPFEYTGGDLTLSVWINQDSGETDAGRIISKPWNGSGEYNYQLILNSSDTLTFALRGATSWSTTTSDTIDTGNWHHIAVTVDGATDTVKIYIDGELSKTDTHNITDWTPVNGDYNRSLCIGSLYPYGAGWAGNTGFSFDGKIDEVKIYTAVLTEEQIKQDYNQGKATVMGAVSTDSSGNPDWSSERSYCIPGDTSTCNPPVAEWKFDEKTGTTAYDTSGNGNDGTLTNMEAADWKSSAECHSGSCLEFDGGSSNEYVVVNDSPSLSLTTALTLEAWVYWDGDTSNHAMIINKENSYELARNTGSAEIWYALYGPSDGVGSMWRVILTGYSLTANQWTHLALTFDGSTVYLYANGRRVYTNTGITGTITDQTTTFRIAGREGAAQYWPGKIDHVVVYNYARTPAQIAWDYNRGKPVGWWKFDECQGATAYDASGNSNNGTITIGGTGSQTSAGTCTDGLSTSAWYNGRNGKYNSSLNFDGTDDYVEVADDPILDLDSGESLSISIWLKPSTVSSLQRFLMKKLTTGVNDTYTNYGAWIQSNSDLYFDIGGNASYNRFSIDANLSAGSWQHIVFVYDSSANTVKTYKNAELIQTDNVTASILSNDGPLTIGRHVDAGANPGYYYSGQIDDVRIYNYALTAEQVKSLYNEGAAVRFGPSSGSP